MLKFAEYVVLRSVQHEYFLTESRMRFLCNRPGIPPAQSTPLMACCDPISSRLRQRTTLSHLGPSLSKVSFSEGRHKGSSCMCDVQRGTYPVPLSVNICSYAANRVPLSSSYTCHYWKEDKDCLVRRLYPLSVRFSAFFPQRIFP